MICTILSYIGTAAIGYLLTYLVMKIVSYFRNLNFNISDIESLKEDIRRLWQSHYSLLAIIERLEKEVKKLSEDNRL